MSLFIVRAVTDKGTFQYRKRATSSFDAHTDAVDRFGPCSVFVVKA